MACQDVKRAPLRIGVRPGDLSQKMVDRDDHRAGAPEAKSAQTAASKGRHLSTTAVDVSAGRIGAGAKGL
jgi:hypothetical protein